MERRYSADWGSVEMSVLIIAEAGVNHNGDLALAKDLIDAAVEAGADLVKFQTFEASRLATRAAEKADYQIASTGRTETQYEMLKRLELDEAMHIELIDYCAKSGKVRIENKFYTLLLSPMSGFYNSHKNGIYQMRVAMVDEPSRMKIAPILLSELYKDYLNNTQ